MNVYNILITIGIISIIVAGIAFLAGTGALLIAAVLNHYYL